LEFLIEQRLTDSRNNNTQLPWADLSCHRFCANHARPWLSVLASNLGTAPTARAVQGDRNLVAHRLAAATREDRETVCLNTPATIGLFCRRAISPAGP